MNIIHGDVDGRQAKSTREGGVHHEGTRKVYGDEEDACNIGGDFHLVRQH